METKNLDRTSSLAEEVSSQGEGSSAKPFKRGHIRRSSYESAQIQLEFCKKGDRKARRVASLNTALNKCASLPRPDTSPLHTMDAACCPSSCTADSGLGESVSSKRSSLDRRSEISFGDWEASEEGSSQEIPSSSQPPPPQTQKKGISLRFPRSIFSRSKGEGRWKVFGERKTDSVVHTTGLILEERPSNLPKKSEEEAARHKELYEQLLEMNKKREAKAEKDRKKALDEKKKQEEQHAAACKIWMDDILPNWTTMRDSKKWRECFWSGIPPKVRGRVWGLLIGNSLNISEELYKICADRAVIRLAEASQRPEHEEAIDEKWNRESSLAQIHLDVSRTFPKLGIFQKGGPYYDLLINLLGAYACYRPDVGYVQSMSFLAAVLLLQMDPIPAFIAFANLLNQPLQVAFFRLKQPQMTEYFIAFDIYFCQEIPTLHNHFDQIDLRPDFYLIEWVYTVFAKSLPLDVTCRVWDLFLRDGEEFIFKTAVGLLKLFQKELLQMEFDDAVLFLTKLPEKINCSELFKNIEPLMKNPCNGESSRGKKSFSQIQADVQQRVNPQNGFSHSEAANLTQLTHNIQGLKLSKSLSEFVSDLLKPQ